MKRAVDSKQIDGIKKLNDLFKDGYEVESIDGNGVYILNKVEMLKAHAIDKQEEVKPSSDNVLKRAMKLTGLVAQSMVKNDGFENGGFEAVKPSSRLTPTEKPTVGHDKSNHELEELINSLQSQLDNARTAILELNDRVTKFQLEQLTQSHQDNML